MVLCRQLVSDRAIYDNEKNEKIKYVCKNAHCLRENLIKYPIALDFVIKYFTNVRGMVNNF